MGSSYVGIIEGTDKNIATHQITEDSVTKHIGRGAPAAGLLTLPSSATLDVPVWVASTAKSVGDWVLPTDTNKTGKYYECTASTGSTGTTEPTWGTTDGGTTTDGDVTWTCRSYAQHSTAIDCQGKGRIIIKVNYSDGTASITSRIKLIDGNGVTIGWVEDTSISNPGIIDGSNYSSELFVIGNEVGAGGCIVRLTSTPSAGSIAIYVGVV